MSDTWYIRPDIYYPRFGLDPRSDLDLLQKSGYSKGPYTNPDSKMLDSSKPNSDILIFSLDIYLTKIICSAPLAELWGVYYGLCIAWDNGIRRLEVEVDSESVVGFLRT